MRKIILVFLTICIVYSFCISTVYAENSNNIFTYDNKEIIISSDNLDYRTMKKIADFVAFSCNTNDQISTCATNCLLGHDIVSDVLVTEIEHNVYPDYFKCVESIYEVEYCTRPSCDYFVKTLLNRERIGSCHG